MSKKKTKKKKAAATMSPAADNTCAPLERFAFPHQAEIRCPRCNQRGGSRVQNTVGNTQYRRCGNPVCKYYRESFKIVGKRVSDTA